MAQIVVEDIDEDVLHLARRGEITTVVAITPDAAVTPDDAIQPTRKRDDEPADAARQCPFIRLDDQMEMILLDGEVRDAKHISVTTSLLGDDLFEDASTTVGVRRPGGVLRPRLLDAERDGHSRRGHDVG